MERWCEEHFLSLNALQTADAIRSELTEILKRIELPVSLPAFGSKSNIVNIKRALLAGFFMQVEITTSYYDYTVHTSNAHSYQSNANMKSSFRIENEPMMKCHMH